MNRPDAPTPIDIENGLGRLVVHLNPYQQNAFVALATQMIHRFEVNRFRSKMKLSYGDTVIQALSNFASAASDATTGNPQKALSHAADAANLLALRLTCEEDQGQEDQEPASA